MAKTYIDGTSCKAISGQFGEFFNVSINVEKLQQYANEKGYVNMTMSKRREVGQYGDTHYFVLNEYNLEAQQNNSAPAGNTNEAKDDISVEDLPF
jgi:hypothetical protein